MKRLLPMAALIFAFALTANPFLLQAQETPGAPSAGATNTPPNGNYPGTGSSITNAPSGPATPGSGNGGATNTPPSGVTPGTGTSPNPTH